jgi:hypothetical protein
LEDGSVEEEEEEEEEEDCGLLRYLYAYAQCLDLKK